MTISQDEFVQTILSAYVIGQLQIVDLDTFTQLLTLPPAELSKLTEKLKNIQDGGGQQ